LILRDHQDSSAISALESFGSTSMLVKMQ